MNRSSFLVVSVAFALPLGAGAMAFESPLTLQQPAVTTADGTIKSVDAKAMTFVLTTGSGTNVKDVTVTVTKDTKYTLDGKDSTMELALVAGNKARVTHTNNRATKVESTTPKKP